jgi:hypothetical protein
MNPHDQISDLVTIAIREIAARRVFDGFFKDEEESRRQYYFPTLEGLEAILIPALAIEGAWVYLVSAEPKIRTAVSEDVEYVLSFNRPSRARQSKQGEPYFFTGIRASKKPFWISECGAFTLSTLINILTLSKSFPEFAPSFNQTQLKKAIKLNVNNLIQCSVAGGGWSWSKEGRTSDAWATWSVIETLTDYLTYEDAYKIPLPESQRVNEKLKQAESYLKSQLDWRSDETIAGLWHKYVFKKRSMQTAKQVKYAYSFVHTMISASLLGLQRFEKFRELAAMLFQSVESVEVKRVENLAPVVSKNKEIDDYSYHPTLLRALTSIYVQMSKPNRDKLTKTLAKPPDFYIHNQFDRLMKRYKREGEWAALWGHNRQYEIYYTERTIEALVSLIEFLAQYRELSSWNIPPAKVEVTKDDIQVEINKIKKTLGVRLK